MTSDGARPGEGRAAPGGGPPREVPRSGVMPDDGLPAEAFREGRPAYGTGSLADLLPSVAAVLGGAGDDRLGLGDELDGVDRVAVLLVDGLGAYQLPLLPGLSGLPARTLTSGFPSTTPVSLVTLGTGQPPGQHGVLGFTARMPDGRILNHIRWNDDPPPAEWQPRPTVFESAGVPSTQVTRPEFEGTGLTVAAGRGAAFVGASTLEETAAGMLGALRAGPGIVYGYHPDLDKAGHESGVGSSAWTAAARDVERLVGILTDGLPPRSALLVTADHGQLNVPGNERIDISALPGLAAVAGEPRVRYLHVVPGALDDVRAAATALFGSSAAVLTRFQAISLDLFGPVTRDNLERIGDLVIICTGRTVALASAYEPPAVGRLVAYHGSVTAAELTIPLLSFVRGSD
ncbi:alkaline phosphatase family protein [Actinoplanes sp. NPDC049265]|uniref:alkaline phosphatase family protein n=1 Tax=Actinoplanes sp. NPDC049265 TaxID=3363902 RepID=UPI00371BF695